MPAEVARVIADFSMPSASEGFGLEVLRRAKTVTEPAPVRPQTMVDPQAMLVQSVENRVREEEREVARRQLEEALDAERKRHQDELAVQRELWIEQESLQLSSQIIEAVRNLENLISERVARILASTIPAALQQKAVEEFNEILGVLLSGEVNALLRVIGPEDLLKAIKKKFSLHDGIIQFEPNDAAEVTLFVGDTTIQTQFSSWASRLKDALKEE